MSTQPPINPPSKRERSALAKTAIGFAVALTLTFGLCSVALVSNAQGTISGVILPIAITVEAICVFGLLVVGFMAIMKKSERKSQDGK